MKLKPDVILASGPAAFPYGPVALEAAARVTFWSPIRDVPIVLRALQGHIEGVPLKMVPPGGSEACYTVEFKALVPAA